MVKAVIFAGGVGSRMNAQIPKQFLKIEDKEIIVHTITKFQECENVNEIVVVMTKDWIQKTNEIIENNKLTKVKKVIEGGQTGQLSIYNGIVSLDLKDDDIVLLHDGVRPFISIDEINNNIKIAKKSGVCITGVIGKETYAVLDNSSISSVINKNNAFIARAPQTFRAQIIKKAHQCAKDNNDFDNKDSCSLIAKYLPDIRMGTFSCSYDNIKITTPDDFFVAESIYKSRKIKLVLGDINE